MTQDQIVSGGLAIILVALGGALIWGSYDKRYPFNQIPSIEWRRWAACAAGLLFIYQVFLFIWRIF